jgi:hypothetical protein
VTRRARSAALAAAWLLVPALAAAVCAPAASGIFPASGIAGTSVVATVTGSALDGATVSVFGDAGLTATVQASAPATLTLRLDLAATATPGERLLFLDTPGGSTGVSFTINPAGGPVIDDVSPPLIATQGIALDVTVTGANLSAVTPASFAVSGAGVSVTTAAPSPDGTTLALEFTVDAAADLGTHAVTLTLPTGSAVLELYVQRPPPTLTAVHPAAGDVGATVPLMLTGTNLSGAALVVTGSGIAVSGVATPDDSTLTATLTIGSGVSPSSEPRLLIVTTESGQTTTEFFVVAPDVPTVTGVEPAAGEPNTTVPVTLHGLHFTGLVGVTTPPGDLTLQNVTVPPVDDETITLDVVVAPGAVTNTDHTLTVTTGAGSAPATFRVIPAGSPFIGAVRPPFGNRGSTFTMIVQGVNLSQVVPGTGVDILDPSNKIHESNAAAVDDRTVRATISIDATANVGSRNVKVTTSAGSFTTANSPFRVNIPGQVPQMTDVSPTLVLPGTTTPMIVTGSNFAGGGVVVTGPGVTVANTMVDPSGTLITFDLILAPDAPAENRAVIVVTENGTARCGIASNPAPPTLVAAKLAKTGALFTVAGTGFRLFVFEFSVNEIFAPGVRTVDFADAAGALTLSRLQAFAVERAFRERTRGFVRVRAVTPTNRIATSDAQALRR